jgi:hypothetical protein
MTVYHKRAFSAIIPNMLFSLPQHAQSRERTAAEEDGKGA